MWIPGVTLLFLLINGAVGAPLSSCPKACNCSKTELICNSFNFLLQPTNETTSVNKLVINNSTIGTNPKLSNFQNLKTLNLASNKIKQLQSAYFPRSVEYLDLSHNFITTLPQDFSATLTRLKKLRLSGNPISCTCDTITIRDQLLQSNVIIATPVKCHSPENLHGKSWLTVPCANDLFGEMQGDAPYEGSGLEEVTQNGLESTNQDKSVEEEFIRVDSATQSTKLNVTEAVLDDEEGSASSDISMPADEIDSDIETPTTVKVNDLLLNNVQACNFDCSTPSAPLPETEAYNDTSGLPPPSILDEVKIMLDDFNIFRGEVTNSTPTLLVTAPPKTNQNVSGSKKTDAEILTNSTAREVNANIKTQTKQASYGTYIFLGALLILIIALAVYAVMKKRSLKRDSHSLNNIDGKVAPVNEVELLNATKSANGTPAIVEAAPLVNGHDDKEVTVPYEEVELRQKPNEAENEEDATLLVPEAKRVTIKASEIPNSTPKTPVLVTRHLNSDGSIITTPTIHQRV